MLNMMIDLGDDPTLSLTTGEVYRFSMMSAGHRISLRNSDNSLYTGVTGFPLNNGQSVDFILPADAPSTLSYICDFHSAMKGQINVLTPP
jgi:plastocyanin